MPFLDLPPEIRFMIYAHLRPSNQYVSLLKLLPEHKATQLLAPSILLTCKSLHDEVLTCWGSSWPPPVEITLATIYTDLRYRPCPGPYWQPEKVFRKIGRVITSKITRVRLVGHSIIAMGRGTNHLWLHDEVVGIQIGFGVKYLVRYFARLKAVDIYAINWQSSLWEPALKRLVRGLDSINRLTFQEHESQKTRPDLRQEHVELEDEMQELLRSKQPGPV